MGVSVGLGYAPMCCPARMAKAGISIQYPARQAVFKIRHLAHCAGTIEATDRINHHHASRVIAPILQTTQAFQQVRSHIPVRDRPDYAAHRRVSRSMFFANELTGSHLVVGASDSPFFVVLVLGLIFRSAHPDVWLNPHRS